MGCEDVWSPRGYLVQDIQCCATCEFGGYLGDREDTSRFCTCEVMGDPESNHEETAVEPLGICDAYKRRYNRA